MKGGVNEYIKIAQMAPKSPSLAVDFCESIFDDFYRCKSFAVTAYYTQHPEKKLKLLTRAINDGLKIKRHVDRAMALVWPLRQLAELQQDEIVAKTTTQIIEDTKPFAGTTEYLDMMTLLVGALSVGSKPNFAILFQAIKKECSENPSNKKDIFLSQVIPVIHKVDNRMANDLIFMIDGETPRKKAEKRIEQEKNLTLQDYFLDLQFKDL